MKRAIATNNDEQKEKKKRLLLGPIEVYHVRSETDKKPTLLIYGRKPICRRKLVEKYSTARYNFNTKFLRNTSLSKRTNCKRRRKNCSVPLKDVVQSVFSADDTNNSFNISYETETTLSSDSSVSRGQCSNIKANVNEDKPVTTFSNSVESSSKDLNKVWDDFIRDNDYLKANAAERPSRQSPSGPQENFMKTIDLRCSRKSTVESEAFTQAINVGNAREDFTKEDFMRAINLSSGGIDSVSNAGRNVRTTQLPSSQTSYRKLSIVPQKWNLISNNIYNYLAENQQDDQAKSNRSRRRKKRGRAPKPKCYKFTHRDPYLECLEDSAELANVETAMASKMGMFMYLGVNRPLFPEVYRNLKSLNYNQDHLITNFWAEFSLSTLVTSQSEVESVKKVFVPVKDPKLFSIVSECREECGDAGKEVLLCMSKCPRPTLRKYLQPPYRSTPRQYQQPPSRYSPQKYLRRQEATQYNRGRRGRRKGSKNKVATPASDYRAYALRSIEKQFKDADNNEQVTVNVEVTTSEERSAKTKILPLTQAKSCAKMGEPVSRVSDDEPQLSRKELLQKYGFKECVVLIPKIDSKCMKVLIKRQAKCSAVISRENQIVSVDAKSTVKEMLKIDEEPKVSNFWCKNRVPLSSRGAAEVETLEENHYFGKENCSRTYRTIVNYVVRNRTPVYYYKIKKMLEFQKSNNKHFKTCSYVRVNRVDGDHLVDILSDSVHDPTTENFTKLAKTYNEWIDPSKINFARSPEVKIALATGDSNIPKMESNNPVDVFKCSKVSEWTDRTQDISFVKLDLLRSKNNAKWLAINLRQSKIILQYDNKHILRHRLIFEVIYRADLSKKVICGLINKEDHVDQDLKFGIYAFPGLCDTVLIGPYMFHEDHNLAASIYTDYGVLLPAVIKRVEEGKNFPQIDEKLEAVIYVKWWWPAMKTDFKDVIGSYLKFIFNPDSLFPVEQEQPKISLEEILDEHQCVSYNKVVFRGKETNFVLLHDSLPDENSGVGKRILHNVTEKNTTPRRLRERKYVPLWKDTDDFSPRDRVLRRTSRAQNLGSESSQQKQNVLRKRTPGQRPPDHLENERKRRVVLRQGRNFLASTVLQENDKYVVENEPLASVITKSKNMIRWLETDTLYLTQQAQKLRIVQKNLLTRFISMLREYNYNKEYVDAGNEFLRQWKLIKSKDNLKLNSLINSIKYEFNEEMAASNSNTLRVCKFFPRPVKHQSTGTFKPPIIESFGSIKYGPLELASPPFKPPIIQSTQSLNPAVLESTLEPFKPPIIQSVESLQSVAPRNMSEPLVSSELRKFTALESSARKNVLLLRSSATPQRTRFTESVSSANTYVSSRIEHVLSTKRAPVVNTGTILVQKCADSPETLSNDTDTIPGTVAAFESVPAGQSRTPMQKGAQPSRSRRRKRRRVRDQHGNLVPREEIKANSGSRRIRRVRDANGNLVYKDETNGYIRERRRVRDANGNLVYKVETDYHIRKRPRVQDAESNLVPPEEVRSVRRVRRRRKVPLTSSEPAMGGLHKELAVEPVTEEEGALDYDCTKSLIVEEDIDVDVETVWPMDEGSGDSDISLRQRRKRRPLSTLNHLIENVDTLNNKVFQEHSYCSPPKNSTRSCSSQPASGTTSQAQAKPFTFKTTISQTDNGNIYLDLLENERVFARVNIAKSIGSEPTSENLYDKVKKIKILGLMKRILSRIQQNSVYSREFNAQTDSMKKIILIRQLRMLIHQCSSVSPSIVRNIGGVIEVSDDEDNREGSDKLPPYWFERDIATEVNGNQIGYSDHVKSSEGAGETGEEEIRIEDVHVVENEEFNAEEVIEEVVEEEAVQENDGEAFSTDDSMMVNEVVIGNIDDVPVSAAEVEHNDTRDSDAEEQYSKNNKNVEIHSVFPVDMNEVSGSQSPTKVIYRNIKLPIATNVKQPLVMKNLKLIQIQPNSILNNINGNLSVRGKNNQIISLKRTNIVLNPNVSNNTFLPSKVMMLPQTGSLTHVRVQAPSISLLKSLTVKKPDENEKPKWCALAKVAPQIAEELEGSSSSSEEDVPLSNPGPKIGVKSFACLNVFNENFNANVDKLLAKRVSELPEN